MNDLINSLLSEHIQSFIEEHYYDDPRELILKYKSIFTLPASTVVDQITGKRKAQDKLPTWYNEAKIIYPRSLNVEQSSSEAAALLKTDLLKHEFGTSLGEKSLVDLTGGFGVDSFFFSRVVKRVYFIEPDSSLVEIARHNHVILGATNLNYHNLTAEQYLDSPDVKKVDIIYIDPSRRVMGNRKVFSFKLSEPDVIALQEKVWQLTDTVLIKASPLLDIQVAFKELKFVKSVHITSLENECKEVLFYCERNIEAEPKIVAVDISRNKSVFTFLTSEEREATVPYSDPLTYLYEPNASILKSGAFKIVGAKYDLAKLHPNTHLYTSEKLIGEFQGRIFHIEGLVKPNRKEILKYFETGTANILTRNYPLTVSEIRKKSGLREGGGKFLIGCSGLNKKFLIAATRVK